MRFVDVDTARAMRGLRLVVLGGVPSLWSEAAKGILRMKGVDFVAVRYRVGDAAVVEWTGVANAPVALYDDEPPRSHWHEILMLAERLDDRVPLVPAAPAARARMFGLSHEICSEMGLGWCARLLILHQSFESKGEQGFPLRLTEHLAPRYGYAPSCAPVARRRVLDVLALLAGELRQSRGPYFFGERPSALDIYAATSLDPFAPFPEADCPMHPVMRKAFDDFESELKRAVPPELLAHRRLMYDRHLKLPFEL